MQCTPTTLWYPKPKVKPEFGCRKNPAQQRRRYLTMITKLADTRIFAYTGCHPTSPPGEGSRKREMTSRTGTTWSRSERDVTSGSRDWGGEWRHPVGHAIRQWRHVRRPHDHMTSLPGYVIQATSDVTPEIRDMVGAWRHFRGTWPGNDVTPGTAWPRQSGRSLADSGGWALAEQLSERIDVVQTLWQPARTCQLALESRLS